MERSILFFDIDGTLITDDERRIFPESAKNAIAAIRAKGHLAYINTGRVAINVDDFILAPGFDGLVCGCGTFITHGNEILLHHKLTKELCKKTAMLIRECNMFAHYEASDKNTLDGEIPVPDHFQELLSFFRKQGRKIETDVTSDDFYFDKFAAWYTKDSDLERFRREIEKDYVYIDRGNGMCEIVPNGYSKASGIQFLMDYYDIPMDRVYAFGDSTNDLPMLSYVKHSIAMEESNPAILDKVQFVTGKVMENGIEYALKHFGLL